MQRLCIQEAFAEGVESLRAWLGTMASVRTAEDMNRAMSQYVENFRGEAIPPAEEEEELLVVTADESGNLKERPRASHVPGGLVLQYEP
ncbi:MAG: hypothetical protein HUU20_07520 [Pirellulales bacterium]|nr:hypothetical protein [Pirellulales bacterium]